MAEIVNLLTALFIPLLCFFVGASVAYTGFVIYSWLPGVRWGDAYRQRCHDLSVAIADKMTFETKPSQQLLMKVQTLYQEFQTYGIHCPPILPHDYSSVSLWKEFLTIITACTQHNDLKKARKAFNEMSTANRYEWETLEENLAEITP